MTAPHDLDRLLSAFLMDGPTELPDQSFDSVRDQIEDTPQRVVIGPWRITPMSKLVAFGLGTAAVIVALVVGIRLIGPPGSSGVGGPAPSTAPSPQPSVVAAPSSGSSPAASSTTADADLPIGSHAVLDVGAMPGGPAMTVQIPSGGWHAAPDFGGLSKGDDDDPPESALLLWSWPAGTKFDVYEDPCKWKSSKPAKPATTVDEIAAALAAQVSRNPSQPVDVTIDGRTGKHITLHVPDDAANRTDAFADCDDTTFGMFAVTGHSSPDRYSQGPGQIDEIWILDVDGKIAIIDAMYRKSSGKLSDTSAATISEMTSIAESTRFQ